MAMDPDEPRDRTNAENEKIEKAQERSEPTHRVGYKNPPIENRFKPGVSGNPSGTRKAPRSSLKDIFLEVAYKPKQIKNDKGELENITNIEATVLAISVNALKNPAIRNLVLLQTLNHEERLPPAEQQERISKTPNGAVFNFAISEEEVGLIEALKNALAQYLDIGSDKVA